MSNISPHKPREVISKLKKVGFVIDRVSGSHYVMFNPTNKHRASVPYHNKDLKLGTLQSIVKQSGLTPKQFQSIK